MARTNQYPLLPDEVVAVYDHIAVAMAAMDPAFKDRIKELSKLKKYFSDKEEILHTIDEAKKIQDAANALLEKAKADAVAIVEKAQGKVTALETRDKALLEAEKALKAKEAANVIAVNQIEATRKAAEKVASDAMAAVDKARDKVNAESARLQSLSASLNDKEVALAQKAERLRSAASWM